MLFFAKLDGDIVGIDRYCRFYANNFSDAQEIADQYAEQNYSEYEDPYDENDEPNFYATICEWNEDLHDKYIGDGCFTDYTRH